MSSLLSARARLEWGDLIALLWVVAWIAVGVAVHGDVERIGRLNGTVSKVGTAIESTGQALGSIELPIVGKPLGKVSGQVTSAGRDAQVSARTSRDAVDELAVLLGLTIALIPSIPVLLLYLPARLLAIREARALRRILAAHAGDADLERVLGERALIALPYAELRKLDDPWADARRGEYGALARAERERLGVASVRSEGRR